MATQRELENIYKLSRPLRYKKELSFSVLKENSKIIRKYMYGNRSTA